MIFLFGFEAGRTCSINWVKQSAIFTSLGPTGTRLCLGGKRRKKVGVGEKPKSASEASREVV